MNFQRKLGRNDPCWCGSNMKYKWCHLGRESELPWTRSEALQAFRKSFERKYCLFPRSSDCNGNIVRAHSIQESMLRKIARDGKVYHFKPGLATLLSNHGVPKASLVGINDASTFTGFCSFHDDKVFAPLEKNSLVFSNEQLFLLHYRAICRELFTKKAASESNIGLTQADRGKSLAEQVDHQIRLHDNSIWTEAGLRDIQAAKAICDSMLLASDFSAIGYLVIPISQIPEVACSGAFFPDYDFAGNQLQDLSDLDQKLDPVSFSIVPTEKGGAVVITWIGDTDACKRFGESFLDSAKGDVGKVAVRMAFDFENLFISPTWWDAVSTELKEKIASRIRTNANILINRSRNYLSEEWVDLPVSWGSLVHADVLKKTGNRL